MAKQRIPEIPEIAPDRDATVQERVYARLRHAIMIGAIPPGTHLTMRGLAETLHLSPTPIREAVRRLSSEHAIDILPNRRMSVPDMTAGRFEELVALRSTLETHAARRAVPHVSDIRIERMASIDRAMDQALDKNDFNRLTPLNHDFHRTLYTANPDPVAMPSIESTWLQLGPFQRQVIERLRDFYVVDRHKEILSALKTRDATAVARAIESDIREGVSRSGQHLLTAEKPGL